MLDRTFAKLASVIAKASGRPLVFLLACFSVIVWAAAGPFFHLSDTWQLVINTTSSIVTFLMVFVIQNTQVRDNAALNAKLDNILKVIEGTDKRLIGVENLTDREIEELRSPPLAR
jgi:low affinity Fe/Cu permease